MKISDDPIFAERIVRDAEERRVLKRPRSPGIHASDLIYCLRQKWLTRKYGLEGTEPDTLSTDTLTLFLTGHAFHALLEDGDAEVEVELKLPGGYSVICTIDYLLPPDPTPFEVKSTRYSSSKTPEEIGAYIDQLATYCLAKRSLRGYLVILHLNGNYKDQRKPVLKVWEITFDTRELAQWAVELSRRYEVLTDASVIPSEDLEHLAWECGYCPYGPKGTNVCLGGMGRMVPFFSADDALEPLEVIQL